MLKKILLAIVMMIPAMAFAQKFGTVDTDAVFAAMPERAEAEEQLANASKTYETELTRLKETYDKEAAEFDALPNDSAIRSSREKELVGLQERIQRFYEEAQQTLARQQQTLLQPIQEKITNAIKKVGANNGFTFIFPLGMAIYSGTDVEDCTNLVKAELGIK